jgi:hypothetical protein
MTTEKTTGLARLREPFEPNQINFLPRAVRKNDNDRFQCRQGTKASVDGKYCGGYHSASIHLDYVGHAALTDRLLEVDPEWSWEPLAIGENGLPVFDRDGGLWIRLKICGVERLGYGDAQGKSGGNAVKEAIGDALRNAGMRFGAALDLWHKGDLHDAAEEQGMVSAPAEEPPQTRTLTRSPAVSDEVLAYWQPQIDECQDSDDYRALWGAAKAEGAPEQILAMIVAAGKKAA